MYYKKFAWLTLFAKEEPWLLSPVLERCSLHSVSLRGSVALIDSVLVRSCRLNCSSFFRIHGRSRTSRQLNGTLPSLFQILTTTSLANNQNQCFGGRGWLQWPKQIHTFTHFNFFLFFTQLHQNYLYYTHFYHSQQSKIHIF